MTKAAQEAEIREHLRQVLDSLPFTVPAANTTRLLGDLCILLCSPAFLYTITPQTNRAQLPSQVRRDSVTEITADHKPSTTPCSLELSYLHICTTWSTRSWATQLMYGDQMLLEGRQLRVDESDGYAQSFLWFCEEASFLAYEYQAKDCAVSELMGGSIAQSRRVVLKGGDRLAEMIRERKEVHKPSRIVALKGGRKLAQLLRGDRPMKRSGLKLKIRLGNTFRRLNQCAT